MQQHVSLEIAGIKFLFIAGRDLRLFTEGAVVTRFLSSNDCSEITLRIKKLSEYDRNDHILKSKIIFDNSPTWQLRSTSDEYICDTGHQSLVIDHDFHSGSLYFSGERGSAAFSYPLDELIMIHLLARRRGILVHSCGVKNDKNSMLFVGASGSGKSTMANLWKKYGKSSILNDDRIIIRKNKNKFYFYGTPWHGDVKDVSAQGAPLKNIFFIKHAKNNAIKKLSSLEAVSRLMVNLFPPFWDKEGMKFTLDFCSDLAERTAFYELNFLPDHRIVDLIKKWHIQG